MYLLTLTAIASIRPPLSVLPERARGGSLAREFEALSTTGEALSLEVPLSWDNPRGPTFSIRYFVDVAHFDASNASAPIFVGMGGEGTMSGASCNSYRTTAVLDYKALCVSVEHRFYGQSVPKDGAMSTANLKHGLSVENNLHDTAAVIDAVRASYGDRTVMNFGGSYSGATCAWFRQLFPTHSAGCVSSSGVVDAIIDFTQFDTHVAGALGPVACSESSASHDCIVHCIVHSAPCRIGASVCSSVTSAAAGRRAPPTSAPRRAPSTPSSTRGLARK